MSKKLRKLREKKGMTADQMADRLSLKKSTYWAYEQGRAEPSIYNLQRICIIHQITIDEFIRDSPTAV
jgi:transcriptional regulator with XRE-family HTH domain